MARKVVPMDNYEQQAYTELKRWQMKMEKKPSWLGRLTKGVQNKVNSFIPKKIHQMITVSIRQMVQAALFGSTYITKAPQLTQFSLEEREKLVSDKLSFYKKAAAVEGAGTGAGGLLLGLADFPLLLSIKLKFLFDAASIYGFDVKDLPERLYILHIFQLAFSSELQQKEVYRRIVNWEATVQSLPDKLDLDVVDWQTFQQEYRDYIDLAKLLQLMPGIGAVVGAYANYNLLDRLGEVAKNCYRLRLLTKKPVL